MGSNDAYECERGHSFSGKNIVPIGGEFYCRRCRNGGHMDLPVLAKREVEKMSGGDYYRYYQCQRGHGFSGRNVVSINGERYCRRCLRSGYAGLPVLTECPPPGVLPDTWTAKEVALGLPELLERLRG